MPRKQNGFGGKSFAVSKVNQRTDKGRGTKAFGIYPSDRRFGSTVTRTAIEQWDLDSTWAMWRRGMEYFFQAAYANFEETNAVLFQGTESEIPVKFTGYRFPTKNADSRSHYTIAREIENNIQLGFITEIQSDRYAYPEQYANDEIWVKVTASRSLISDLTLLRSIGDRVGTDTSAANILNVLTTEGNPAVYIGKSRADGMRSTATVPLDEVKETEFVKKNGIEALVGKVVYEPAFYTARPVTQQDVFTDDDEFMSVEVNEVSAGIGITILDTDTNLPPTLGDIEDLDSIYTTENGGNSKLGGQFIFKKSDYQRYFGKKYLTADLMRSEVATLSYAIMPYIVLGVRELPATNSLELVSVPFQATLSMYAPTADERTVVFAGNSFTVIAPDYNEDGEYNHAPEAPGAEEWQKLKIGVDPWMDQTFIAGDQLLFADLYTCSCPSYLHAKIRSPETLDEEGRKLNRQSRIPLPTAKSADSYTEAGILKVAGIIESWGDLRYKRGFKLCKHTVAAMFIDKIRVEEPNTFPSVESRKVFEEKLKQDIEDINAEYINLLKRSEITTVEIVYSLAEALNLDDVELGYVMQTASF